MIISILNILINLIDVIVIILPVLLAVAFMTIIERKQLAAHQRRVGPNTTGYSKLNKKDYLKSNRNPRRNFIRFCHNLSNNNKNIIKELNDLLYLLIINNLKYSLIIIIILLLKISYNFKNFLIIYIIKINL